MDLGLWIVNYLSTQNYGLCPSAPNCLPDQIVDQGSRIVDNYLSEQIVDRGLWTIVSLIRLSFHLLSPPVWVDNLPGELFAIIRGKMRDTLDGHQRVSPVWVDSFQVSFALSSLIPCNSEREE